MPTPRKLTNTDALLMISEQLRATAYTPNILSYKPHPKQVKFHQSVKKAKLYIGGNRSGKTTGGVCEDVWRATCRHPYRHDLNQIGPNRGRVVGVSFIEGVEKILFPQFKQWLYPSAMRGGAWETAYDKQLKTLFFENGSFIEFMSYDQDLDKFAGTSRHWIHFDEEPPKPIWQECKARLIDTGGDYYITMTPVEGMTWIHDDLYEPNVEKPWDEQKCQIIEVDMRDNPHLSKSAIEEYIDGLDDEDLVRRVQGKFEAKGGLIYKSFDSKIGGLHVLEEEIPNDEVRRRFGNGEYIIVCSLDHGLNNPTAVYWTAIDTSGFCITFREHYKSEWTVDQHAARIKQINREHGIEPDIYVADPSIAQRNAVTNTSVYTEYVKFGVAFTMGNNDVNAGIGRMRRYLKADKRTGIARWRVTPDCKELIREMKKYRWKTYRQKSLNFENNAYDEPHKKDDHGCDSIRYMVMSRPDLFADATEDLVNGILAKGGPMEGAVRATDGYPVADPRGLLERDDWNSEYNTVPGVNASDWEVDEHMGGIY